MGSIAYLLIFFSTIASGNSTCPNSQKNLTEKIQDLSNVLSLQATYVRECADAEIFDPLLDPFRKQSFALSLCQKSETCLDFLREKAAQVSGHEKTRYINLPATALWGLIGVTANQIYATGEPVTQ